MFAGTWTLIKLILRRDRLKLPIWLGCIVVLLIAMVPMLGNLYGDEASLLALQATFGANPAGMFLTGPFDTPTLGGLMTIETLLWWGMAVAFMNTFLVIRHTRHNEEIGAQELILSGQVHRSAGLIAILVVAFVANAIIVTGIGVGLSIFDHWPVSGSWLYALSMGAFGMVWAGIAMVVAQLVESTRLANGILAGLIGAAFALRGVGDFTSSAGASGLMEPSWWSWLSPFGWMQAARPLTAPEWWPLVIPILFVIFSVSLAFVLMRSRDVGRGVLPALKGRARASRLLKTPAGLAWYVQKNVFVGWLIGTLAMALTIGVLVPEMSSVYNANDSLKAMIESIGGSGSLIPAFLSAMLSILALMVIAYAIQGASRLRGEEYHGYLENVLATRVSRISFLALHTLIILTCSAVIMGLSGLVLALAVNIGSPEYSVSLVEYILAGLSYLPVIALFVALYVLLFGMLPRLANLVVWAYYGIVVFITWLGPILQLSHDWASVSIMEHVASPPVESVVWIQVMSISAVSGIVLVAGATLWRGRNLIER